MAVFELRTKFRGPSIRHLACLFLVCAIVSPPFAFPSVAQAADPLVRVTFTEPIENKEITVDGKIVVTAQDGGILLLGRDGRLWNVTPAQMVKQEEAGQEFSSYSADEITARLKDEFLIQLSIVKTEHFIIASGTEGEYAEWCGETFEALYKSFFDHWKGLKIELHEPEFPLVAVIFPNQTLFAEHAVKEGGQQARNSHGYYWVPTNRIILYDLTANLPKPRRGSRDGLRERLEASAYNVATVVHEATHQIAFNCGLHARLADNPLWLTEGMAMYCETPDLKSRGGWKTIGKINKHRLRVFQNFVRQRRTPDSLTTLITDGKRFASDPMQTGETYGEAWALTYFLVKEHPAEYAEYLKRVSAKQPLIWDTPDARLKEFTDCFGEELDQLDREFLRSMMRLSAR